MKIEFTEKNYKISDKLKEVITKKISKLERYFGDAVARVVCKMDNKTHKLEVTITNKGLMYRAEVVGENMYENIDFALPKIERQVIKQYEKKRDKFRDLVIDYSDLAFLDEKPEIIDKGIIKKKYFNLDPITVEDAKDYLDTIGHDFYVFLNAENGKVNILYNRKDDRLGLIECNF